MKVLPTTLAVPPELARPPPEVAELPVKVLPVDARRAAAALSRPPPRWPSCR